MKKRMRLCTAIIVGVALCVLPAGSAVGSEGTIVKEAPVARFTGNWFEIGKQVGMTYPEFIYEFGQTMGMVLNFAGPGNGWTPQAYYEEVKDLLPQSSKDHMQGMAEGLAEASILSSQQAWDIVLTQNFATDLLNMKRSLSEIPAPSAVEIRGCTAFAVTSAAGSFLCHNTDATFGSGDDNTAIMYWAPDNGDYAYLTMDPPGWADVAYALNENGIGVSMNAGRPNDNGAIGMPVNFMIRNVMEKAATLDEAVGFFQDLIDSGKNFGPGGAMVHIMDFNEQTMARLQIRSAVIDVTYGEENPSGATYIASANHYTGDFNPDSTFEYESSFERYDRLIELMNQTETFDPDTCWSILSDTNGGEADDNTISRRGDTNGTVFATIFTEDGVYYTLGPPHEYFAVYDSPAFAGYETISSSTLAAFAAVPGSRKITLNWQVDNSTGITGYNLYRSASQAGAYEKLNDTVITGDQSTITYEDTGLANRNRYFYKLGIVGAEGETMQTAIASATPRLLYLLFPVK